MNHVDSIIRYEQGELNEEETTALFGRLVRTGQAWALQGHYGRTAASLIEAGYLDRDGTVLDPDRRCEREGCHVPAPRGGSCGNHPEDAPSL